MSVNHKQMYTFLKQEAERLNKIVNGEEAIPTEIPADFNQRGFDITIAATENMLAKLKEARANKGKRLTPQFFRSIFNRCLLADVELNKFLDSVRPEPENVDYSKEVVRLTAEVYELNRRIEEQEATKQDPAPETQEGDKATEDKKSKQVNPNA